MINKDTYAENVGKWMRSSHPYAFRSGSWAEVIAVYTFRDRPNYVLVWPEDARADLWVCDDPVADYEFKDV